MQGYLICGNVQFLWLAHLHTLTSHAMLCPGMSCQVSSLLAVEAGWPVAGSCDGQVWLGSLACFIIAGARGVVRVVSCVNSWGVWP